MRQQPQACDPQSPACGAGRKTGPSSAPCARRGRWLAASQHEPSLAVSAALHAHPLNWSFSEPQNHWPRSCLSGSACGKVEIPPSSLLPLMQPKPQASAALKGGRWLTSRGPGFLLGSCRPGAKNLQPGAPSGAANQPPRSCAGGTGRQPRHRHETACALPPWPCATPPTCTSKVSEESRPHPSGRCRRPRVVPETAATEIKDESRLLTPKVLVVTSLSNENRNISG